MKTGCENQLLLYMRKLPYLRTRWEFEKIKFFDTLINSHQPKKIKIETSSDSTKKKKKGTLGPVLEKIKLGSNSGNQTQFQFQFQFCNN
jgi:hypothetical protein